MNRLTNLKTLITCVVVIFLVPAAVFACPTCKDGLAGDPATSGMVQGYFWSILFMMSMPFLILGGISAYFYYEVRRARRLNAQAEAETTDEQVGEPLTQA